MPTPPIPLFDLRSTDGQTAYRDRLARLAASSTADSRYHEIAAALIADVAARGDDAIVEHMRQFNDPDFTADRIRVSPEQIRQSLEQIPTPLRDAMARAVDHVRQYQDHICPTDPPPITIDGAALGLRWSPIQPAGLLVPGGSAVLFSTLIMLAVPAMAAGLTPDQIAVVSPPPYRKPDAGSAAPAASLSAAPDIAPATLAAAAMLGIDRVYRIGGPPAVAALATGTQRVDRVNIIAGPGHPVVQAAKLQVAGRVAIDGFLGSSEIVTIADASADPARIASDLLAQAEHDPGQCFLIAWDDAVISAVLAAIESQLPSRTRRTAIEKALAGDSCIIRVSDARQAAEIANQLAGEHVNLAVADPQAMLDRIAHGGEFFLGDATPVAAGDYYAGPSHCLPTGTSARYASGVSVFTFLKRSGSVAYANEMPAQAIDDIARMAEAEGLDAHAASARTRATT